jgi:hypothetical protein
MHTPQPFRRRSAALAVLLSGLLGCQDATAPTACDRPLQVFVTSGVTPTITWAPSCGISYLSVMQAATSPGEPETLVWGFTVPELTPLGPGVRYGSLPTGATAMVPAQSLRVGATYRVYVTFLVGGDVSTSEGSRIFVP